MQKLKLYLLPSIIFLSFLPSLAEGTTLYFSPSTGEYHQDDIFITEIRLNTEGENINACEININFSLNSEIVDISNGGSILTLWPQNPIFSNKEGTLSFMGGIPAGFSGDGKLVSIIFHNLSATSTKINFQSNSKVLLNDGFGTPTKLNNKTAQFTILPEKLEIPKNEWKAELEKDAISPELFEIKINKIEGKYFVIFSTIDQQSGIGRYEIKEGGKDWKIGVSPYLLEDQNLGGKIWVKAIDKAGNERMAEILPQKPLPYWIVILVLIIIGAIFWVKKKFKRKR